MKKTCEFCGSLMPEDASYCGHCGSVSSLPAETRTMASDFHIPEIQSIDTRVLEHFHDNRLYDQQSSVSASPTTSPGEDEEEEERRKRALLLGMGVPLLGSLAVEDMPGAENVPMVEGTPEAGEVPNVQGSPYPQGGSMGQNVYASPTIMAPQPATPLPMSPLPTTTVSLPASHHPHHPGNPATPPPKPHGCSLAVILAAIMIPILIILSLLGLGLTVYGPSIALSGGTTVVPGGTFTLFGNHFIPGSSVTLTLDDTMPLYFARHRPPEQVAQTTATSMQLLTIDALESLQIGRTTNTVQVGGDGTFSVPITVNPNWSIGKHTITATETPTHRSTSLDFTISSTGATPTNGAPGSVTPTPSQTPSPPASTTRQGLSCVNPATLSLGPVMQGSNQPVSAQVTLCGSGTGTINWTAAWDQNAAPWLQLDHTAGAIPAPGQTQVTASAVATNLSAGNHTVTVTFSSQPDNTTQSLQVLFTVQGGCVSGIPASLNYTGVANVGDPNSQIASITNCGPTGAWSGAAHTDSGGDWLFTNSTGGTLNSGASSKVSISASNLKAQLAAGTYTGSVTFKIGTGTFIVHVTLTVISAPTLSATPRFIRADQRCSFNQRRREWLCSVSLTNNSSALSLDWSATSSGINGIQFDRSNGTLAPGQTMQVQFSVPLSVCPNKGILYFTGPANTARVEWYCIAG